MAQWNTEKFEALKKEAKSCQKCKLSEQRNNVVFSDGPENTDLMFVGEAPGRNEDEQGVPFVGRAGSFMNKLLSDLDISRSSIYITNIVKCRPPENRNPEQEEMEACRDYLQAQIRYVDPKVIVALGSVAAQRMARTSKRISQIRGDWFQYEDRTPVLPTFHPAYLLRNRSAIKEFRRDMKKIFEKIPREKFLQN